MERGGVSLGSNRLLRGAHGKQQSPVTPSRRAEGRLLAPSPSLFACRRDIGDQDVAAHTTGAGKDEEVLRAGAQPSGTCSIQAQARRGWGTRVALGAGRSLTLPLCLAPSPSAVLLSSRVYAQT